ncbi:MAG TPA: hypothetical protein VK537_03565, partial [Galbitalea sp.]|nr:hypothetical protein [Galbitalea sp.]
MNTPGNYVAPGSYTYTAPAGVFAIAVTAQGAGGSKGFSSGAPVPTGSGGPGGGISSELAVVPGQVI